MKKNILFGLACFAFSGALWAAPVTPQNAQKAALHFMQMETGNHAVSLKQFDYPQNEKYNQAAFYVFTTEQQPGFVIISADDAVRPVLGYSTNNDFAEVGNISPEVSYWLDWYAQQIYAVQQNNLKATDAIHEEWDNLLQDVDLSGGEGDVAQKVTGVAPFLATTWGQLPYYNDLCPATPYASSNPTYHAPAGCVATAMAQIMKYWETPTTTGTGSHSYGSSTVGGTLSANFGNTIYEWNNMPNTLTSSSSPAEKDAIATLMYHCGVSVNMDYDIDASGALVINHGNSSMACSQNAMTSYFGYSSSIQGYERNEFTDSTWVKMLQFELDNGRPVLYTGYGSVGGHAFDFDGYNNNGYFHINWGWRGLSNGYFVVDNLSPSALGQGGGGGNFNYSQEALIMIEPAGSTLPPNPYQPDASQSVADFNLTYAAAPTSQYDTIHVGDSYAVSGKLKNNGPDDFDGQNILFVGALDVSSSNLYLIDYQSASITSGSAYQYDFSKTHFDDLNPGNYFITFGYADANGNGDLVTDNSGQYLGVSLTVLPKDNTGIENAAQNNAFKVFPNPAHNEIHVKATGDSETPESVQLMDVTGRMVYENKNLSGTDITIPVRGLSAGMYYLRLTTSKGSQIEKVSVQH